MILVLSFIFMIEAAVSANGGEGGGASSGSAGSSSSGNSSSTAGASSGPGESNSGGEDHTCGSAWTELKKCVQVKDENKLPPKNPPQHHSYHPPRHLPFQAPLHTPQNAPQAAPQMSHAPKLPDYKPTLAHEKELRDQSSSQAQRDSDLDTAVCIQMQKEWDQHKEDKKKFEKEETASKARTKQYKADAKTIQAEAETLETEAEDIERQTRDLQAAMDRINFDDITRISAADLRDLFDSDPGIRPIYDEMVRQIEGLRQDVENQGVASRQGVQQTIERNQQSLQLDAPITPEQLRYDPAHANAGGLNGGIPASLASHQAAAREAGQNGNHDAFVAATERIEREVGQLTEQSQELLDLPHVTVQFEQGVAQSIREHLNLSNHMAHEATGLATNNAQPSVVQFFLDYAADSAVSIYRFLQGVNAGAGDALIGLAQTAQSIYNDPTLLTNLSTHVMNTITAGPGASADAVVHRLNVVGDALLDFQVTMSSGTAHERGHALGEFGTHVVLGVIGGEIAQEGREVLNEALGPIVTSGAIDTAGARIIHEVRLTPELAHQVQRVEQIVDSAGDLLKGWARNHKIVNIHEAEAINRAFIQDGWKAPYQAGTKVVEFVTKEESQWIRVHGANNQVGGWLVKKDAIRGLSPDQIRHKYALPNEPIFVSDVHVPSGTTMHRGHVRYIQWDESMRAVHPEGAIQYQLQDRIPTTSFKNGREIGGIFNE